ncbi:MAG: DUF1553 domain-containing protein [Verrucomicrobiota bacterium]|nr:DUF1553 domain-containing protein [Verrucomicrobiota bacterium]
MKQQCSQPAQHMLTVATLLASLLSPLIADDENRIEFNRDIRPILSDNCFQCHGPDAKHRKAGLRLDTENGAFRNEGGVRPFVAGKLGESEAYRRITTNEPDNLMPPPDSGRSLTDAEQDSIRRWIEQGAEWQRHWAFIPPKRTALPLGQALGQEQPRNAIDHFILAKLRDEQLAPSPEAAKRTLIRRATLDLTGLPPTPTELEAFVADRGPRAYERLIDHLLASPHYGEHMAQGWLDAARYADTNGFQADRTRNQWHWRDWVVDALNRNMPFDQFTIEQLAGDLLPNPSLDQLIATGFNRNHMLNGEGGAIAAETQVEYVVDRVETTGTVWLGLTVGCARCHDHKYDPISQREFYQLFAFFNNLPEKGGGDMEPTTRVATSEQARQLRALEAQLDEHRSVLNLPLARFDDDRKKWEAPYVKEISNTGRLDGWQRIKPDTASSTAGSELTIQNDASVLASGKLPDHDEYKLTFRTDLKGITGLQLETLTDSSLKGGGPGREGNFVLTGFELLPGVDEINLGNLEQRFDSGVMTKGAKRLDIDITGKGLLVLDVGDTGNGISSDWADWGEPNLEGPDGTLKLTDLNWHSGTTDYRKVLKNKNVKDQPLRLDGKPLKWGIGTHAKSRIVFRLPKGYTRFKAIVGPDTSALEEVAEPQTSIRFTVSVSAKNRPGELNPLQFASAVAEFNQDGLSVNGAIDNDPQSGWGIWKKNFDYNQPRKAVFRLKETWAAGKGSRFTLKLRHQHGAKKHLLGRFRLSVTSAPEPSLEMAEVLPEEMIRILKTPPAKRLAEQSETIAQHHRSKMPDFIAAKRGEVSTLTAIRKLTDSFSKTMVMREMDQPRDTYLLVRGVYDQPDKNQSLKPGVPNSLPGLAKPRRANRLDLAHWLTDSDHPLTARVTVNRYWQHFFGTGLVKTTEDFGVQGERPVNSALLDWLATEFVISGWNVKHLHRLIVTSAAYRQSSVLTPEQLERDPENRFITRGPRHRMSAQTIRDQALAISGKLWTRIGGPPVRPYQPPGVWSDFSYGKIVYKQDNGEALYRRSLYTFWRRSVKPAMFFDNPARRVCSVRPRRTNTPMHALNLLNDTTYVEAARCFAEQLLRQSGSDTDRLGQALKMATGRPAQAEEVDLLAKRLAKLQAHYANNPSEANELLAVGQAKPDPTLNAIHVASLTGITSLILNLDEVLTKE